MNSKVHELKVYTPCTHMYQRIAHIQYSTCMDCLHLTSLPTELLLRLQQKLYFSQFASTDVCLRPAVTHSPSLVPRLTLSKCAMNTMATKKQPSGMVAVRWDMPDSKYDGVVHFVSDSLVDEVGNGRVVVWWLNCSQKKKHHIYTTGLRIYNTKSTHLL